MPFKKSVKKAAGKKAPVKKIKYTSAFSLADNKYLVIMLMVCSFIPLAMVLLIFFSNFRSIAQSTMPEVFIAERMPVFGQALEVNYNASNLSKIEAANSHSLNAKLGFTAEAWIKPSTTNANGYIFSKSSGSENGFSLYVRSEKIGLDQYNTVYEFRVADAFLSYHATRNIMMQYVYTENELKSWHHVAGVIQSDGKMDIFIDGQRSTMNFNSIQNIWSNNLPIYIGVRNSGSNYYDGFFHGTIDEVRISSISRYANNFIPQLEPFAVDDNTGLLWHIDGNTTDSTTNNRGGIISGDVMYVDSTIVPLPAPTMSPSPTPLPTTTGKVRPTKKPKPISTVRPGIVPAM